MAAAKPRKKAALGRFFESTAESKPVNKGAAATTHANHGC